MKKKNRRSRKFVGVDLHKNRFTTFVIESQDRYSKTYELSEMNEFLATLDPRDAVGVEASTNTFAFYDLLKRRTDDVTVFNPHRLKVISEAAVKTDKVDAEKIATVLKMFKMSGENIENKVYVPDQNIRDLRSLFATYKNFKRHIVMWRNRIHALLAQHMILIPPCDMSSKVGRCRILKRVDELPNVKIQVSILFDQLSATENGKSAIEELILKSGKEFLNTIEILTSISGISVFTALAIIADVADISRFKNPKKLAMYLRSAPEIDSSNNVTKIKRTTKAGRRLSIELLIQSTTHFQKENEKLKNWYKYKKGQRGAGKARMAICRKIITQIWHMWSKEEKNRFCNNKLHSSKIAAYKKFLAKDSIAA